MQTHKGDSLGSFERKKSLSNAGVVVEAYLAGNLLVVCNNIFRRQWNPRSRGLT